jgi:NADH dehydrogenase/NADH:ubiquinone oxidoreductase subunit G
MVEIEKMPRVQIACNTVVAEGMVVRTNTDKAKAAQRSSLELLLINHPIDCPVCDQAGECYLQDSYMRYGLHDSEVEIEEKVKKRKVQDLGPIMLDAERCVLCTRCVRFEETVTGTNSLEFRNRGDHKEIGTYKGLPITSAASRAESPAKNRRAIASCCSSVKVPRATATASSCSRIEAISSGPASPSDRSRIASSVACSWRVLA